MAMNLRNTPTLSIVRGIMRSHEKIRELTEADVKEFGLSLLEFDVIATLGNQPPMAIEDIRSTMLSVDGDMLAVLGGLVSRGIVQQTDTRYGLTAEGDEIFDVAYSNIFTQMRRRLKDTMSRDEQKTFIDLLDRFLNIQV